MGWNRKFGFVNRFRSKLDRIGLALPLPDVHPNVISGMSVITSFAFLAFLRFSLVTSFSFLILTLLLDWFDGLTAKKFFRDSEEGYLADMASDRLSEGIMFSVFFPWFCLFAANCLLAMVSVARRRHVVLPLRHVFVIYMIWLIWLQAHI